jgi:hypothetical protein
MFNRGFVRLTVYTARQLAVFNAQHDVYSAAGKLGMAVRHNRPPDEIQQRRRDLDAARELLAAMRS